MSNLTRWDPYREMFTLRNAMDRLFASAYVGPSFAWQSEAGLALDVTENPEEYIVKASVPGANPDDLEITYNNNVLTIKGEVKAEKEVEEQPYLLRERRYGSFTRSFTLPSNIKADAIQASHENGVLTLHLPKAEEAKPKRIPVQAAQVIEGKAADIKSKN
jgi:HSP20 family protein